MSNFQHLPPVQFAELDPQVIESAVIAGFERAAQMAGIENFRLFPGDPRRLFLHTLAYYITQQNFQIDQAGKMNLLPYAEREFLDNLAGLYGERGRRLKTAPAVTTLEFTLSKVLTTDLIIRQGTRATPGNNIIFATDKALIIRPGELTGQVSATCITAGVSGNGFLPGQINILIDQDSPFVQNVSNITESALGADTEKDDEYRQRIWILPESFSVAGPAGAYQFWAMSASAAIADVGVYSPVPGVVHLYVLMQNGALPTQEVLDKVLDICCDRRIRPLTDQVFAFSPEQYNYNLKATYWIDRINAPAAGNIMAAVSQAVNEFVTWQKSRLGRDLNPSVLIHMIMEAGARRVEIDSPHFKIMSPSEIAVAGSVDVTFGGLEDD
jgi:phage-related baseplate assembly protein